MTDDEREAGDSRRESEREAAERRYSAALVALDAASNTSATVARSAAAAAADVARLNQAWQQPAAGAQGPPSLAARILMELRRLMPWRRRRIFGAMVAAVNRNTETTRAVIDATQHFHSHVVWYAQTIAALAEMPRRGEGGPRDLEALHRAINSVHSDWLKHWEALSARDERSEARMSALTKAYDDLRDAAALAQQSTLSLKRVIDERDRAGVGGAATSAVAARGVEPREDADTDAFKYVGFEDRFRGSRDDIRQRLLHYVPLLSGASNVLEIGCGRGELLDLLREQGVSARGVDLNDDMIESCRTRGLDVERADGLAFLESQPDASLGGLVAIQVVEHLEPARLMRLLETAQHKLKPGAPMILETINAACWAAFFDSYIRDFTHVRPLHPDTLKYLVQASGFRAVDLQFLSPLADEEKLPLVRTSPTSAGANPTLTDLVEAVNAHADRLNRQLFTFRDFAIIART